MNFILKTFPVNLNTNVPMDTDIEITFLIDMNKDSFSESNVILLDLEGHAVVPVEFEYKSKLLIIKASEKLKPLTHYQVELVGASKNGVQDILGRNLVQSYKFEFTTATELRVKGTQLESPTDLSEIRGDIPFKWKPVTGAYHYELQISKSNTFNVLEWPTREVTITDTEIIPDIKYEIGLTYYTRVRVINEKGNRSTFSPIVRFYYNGKGRKELDSSDTNTLFTQTIHAAEGDILLRLGHVYHPGVGDLAVLLNGVPILPCSSPMLSDGQYREIDQQMIMMLSPLHLGDILSIQIDKKPPENDIEPPPGKSELDILKDFFDNKKDTTPKYLRIKSLKPKDGAVMISDASRITITFDQEVDANSIDPDTVYVIEERN